MELSEKKVKQEIEEFHQKQAPERNIHDCFLPWYLHKEYGLSLQDALAQTSCGKDPNTSKGDEGLDGFTLDKEKDPIILTLFQAKMSSDASQLCKGIRDLTRFVPHLYKFLMGQKPDVSYDNQVITALNYHLQKLSDDERKKIQIKFVLLHMCPDKKTPETSIQSEIEELKESCNKYLDPWDYDVKLETPLAVPPPAPRKQNLFAEGKIFFTSTGQKIFLGMCKLKDLVELDILFGNQLYAKNVKLFLTKELKKPLSAHSKIKESLSNICLNKKEKDKLTESHFMIHHNGVTLCAETLELNEENHFVTLRGTIIIINGCQTTRTARKFYEEYEEKISKELWDKIYLPVRIIETSDDALIEAVSINNNRQTVMQPWALYAHKEEQTWLERHFGDYKIIYERREGAYDAAQEDWGGQEESRKNEKQPDNLQRIHIKDLAQILASITIPENIPLARRPKTIFSSDKNYEKIFNKKYFSNKQAKANTTLLIFAVNLARSIRRIIADIKDEYARFEELHKNSLRWPMLHIGLRYIIKKSLKDAKQYCDKIYRENVIRDAFGDLWLNKKSELRRVVKEVYLEDFDDKEELIDRAFDPDLLDKAVGKLYLRFDPFEKWSALKE